MEFEYAYSGSSSVQNTGSSTAVSFAPDTKREPTFFRGRLQKSLEFREAISALHDVVVSDMRWQPKDRAEYMQWREQQDEIDWIAVASQQKQLSAKIENIQKELQEVRFKNRIRMAGFYAARQVYFNYLYLRDYDAWMVLDPVITVHPDEVFFECFSQDESTYGRLSAGLGVFKDVGEFACGTTNVDYSAALYDEFQKIRTYKETNFEVDPTGFEVQTTGEATYKELKIDLPDTWVRGFLQVSSAMSLPMVSFQLHPMDIHNICFVLRRNKELKGPRSIRYNLKPGEPVRIVFDPWEKELVCPRSIYTGNQEHSIRVWGRRRLHVLERLVAQAKSFQVHLLGNGMPSFYLADLGEMTFTLGLSGWTSNNWSEAGNFDLLAPRAEVDSMTQERVFAALKERWFESPESLSKRLGLDQSVVLGALGAYTQAGRAIWDLKKNVYRARELSRDPLPMDQLRFSSPLEKAATEIAESNLVNSAPPAFSSEGGYDLRGTVKDKKGKSFDVNLQINADEQMTGGVCGCNFYQQNKFRKGPCEHLLALRMDHKRRANVALR